MDWFARNQHADGRWLYHYDADTDRRHARVQRRAPRRRGDGPLPGRRGGHAAARCESADRGTAWALDRLTSARRLDHGVPRAARSPTGATALLVAGLDIRREATGDRRYDDAAPPARALPRRPDRAVGRGARLVRPDPRPARCRASTRSTTRARPTGRSRASTAPSRGEGWGKVADRIGAYLATKRDDAEDHWPPIEDHWAAYGLSETVRFPERGRPPLTARRAGLRAQPGRAVRRRDALDQPALRAVGRARARARTSRAAAGTA